MNQAGDPRIERDAKRITEWKGGTAEHEGEEKEEKDEALEDMKKQIREGEIKIEAMKAKMKKEIADALSISVNTVSTHLRRVYDKLHVNTNTGAVAKALREGII